MKDKPKNTKYAKVLVYFLPLTWLIYILWRLEILKRDYDGCYRCDPEFLWVSRLSFDCKHITGKTKKGTKFCGNWHWFNLIFWEVHMLIDDYHDYVPDDDGIKFP